MSSDQDKSEFLLAGELAEKAGVSSDTLRHYERKGVLARPRRARNNYRLYPAAALDRVLLVRRALAIGFTLDELAKILAERDQGAAPCRTVHRLAAAKLRELEARLRELQTLRDDLSGIVADWDTRLAQAPADKQIHLLASLPEAANNQPKRAKFGANKSSIKIKHKSSTKTKK